MIMRGHSAEFKPFFGWPSIAVHCAMDQYCWYTCLVGVGDTMNEVDILLKGETFVVHDNVESVSPVRIIVNGQTVVRSVSAFVDDRPLCRGARPAATSAARNRDNSRP